MTCCAVDSFGPDDKKALEKFLAKQSAEESAQEDLLRDLGNRLIAYFQDEPVGKGMDFPETGTGLILDKSKTGALKLEIAGADHKIVATPHGDIFGVSYVKKRLIPIALSEGDQIAIENLLEVIEDLACQGCDSCIEESIIVSRGNERTDDPVFWPAR